MDFITIVPPSWGNTVILTAVGRFSKMCHFIPLPKLSTASNLVDLLLIWVFIMYGILEDIVLD